MRRLDPRWLAGVTIGAVCLAGFTFVVHRYQLTRIASVFLREARRAQEENRPDDAVRNLRSYVSLRPDEIEGLALYGKQLAESDRIGPAYLTLEKVLRRDPQRSDSRRTLVTLAMRMRRYSEALSNIEELLKLSSKDGELWQWKGICQAAQFQYELAVESLTTAITIAPEQLESYSLLASLQSSRLKNPEAAIKCINLMVTKNDQNYQAYLNRAQWRLQLLNSTSGSPNIKGDSGELATREDLLLQVSKDASRARELSPQSSDVLALDARIALVTQKYDDARQTVQRGLELHPTDARFYLILADVEMETANSAAALDALKRGVAAAPRDRDLRWNLANRLIDQGATTEEVGAALQQLRSMGHPSELVDYLEARLLIRQKQWQQAISRLEATRPRLQAWPKLTSQSDLLLALAYRESDAGDQQIAAYRRILELDTQSIPARRGLADSLLAANQVLQAADEYRRVLTIPGAPPVAAVSLARCLMRLAARQTKSDQDWSEFDRVLNQIERQDPQSVQVQTLRVEKLLTQGLMDEAIHSIAAAREKNPEEIDLWIFQIMLAQLDRNWENADAFLEAAEKKFGDTVTLRIVRGRYMLLRYGSKAKDQLKTLSQPAPTWDVQEKFVFLRNFAMFAFAMEDFAEAERLAKLGTELNPGDLSIRLLLFDIALREKKPELMGEVLLEVRGITGEGPLWNYGEAVRLTLDADLSNHDAASLEKARLHLGKAKAIRPSWARIPLLNAEIYRQQGNLYAETEQLRAAILLGERSPAVLSKTVRQLFSQRRFNDADWVVRRLQERQELFTADMIRSASEISLRLEDTSRALDLAEQAAQEKDSTPNKLWLGHVLGQLGRFQEAEQVLRTIIESDPGAHGPWVVLVQVLSRSNQQEKAEQVTAEAEKAIAADEMPLAIARCYELLGKVDQAQSRYQSALDLAPGNIEVVQRVVDFYLRSGRAIDAEPLLRTVLENSKELSVESRQQATRSLALALTIKGSPSELDEALRLVDRNLAIEARSPADERLKALVLSRQPSVGQRKEAIKILKQLLVYDSDTAAEDRFLLARLYMATGDRSNARSEIRTLLGLNAKDARYIIAYLQLLLPDEPADAEIWVEKLQKLAPNDLMTADFRAQLLFAKKRYSEVIAVVKEAAGRASDEKENSEHLLWGARRLEVFGQRLLNSKDGSPDDAAHFYTEAEPLYQQHVQRRPKEVLALAEYYAHANKVDRALDLLKEHSNESTPQLIAAVSVAVMKNVQTTSQQLRRLQELLQKGSQSQERPVLLDLVLADLMSWRGDIDGAVRLYDDVLKREPRSIQALNNLAVLLALSGNDVDRARRLIEQAIHEVGNNDSLLDTQGMVYLAAGAPAKALADFEASLRENESSERYFHAARACAQLKQTAAAKRALAQAQKRNLTAQILHPLERPMLAKLLETLNN